VWKSNICEHKIYPAIVLFSNAQRPSSMGGWQNDIPRSFENLFYGPLKAFLVFYEKNSSYIFSVSDGSFVSPGHFSWLIDARQINLKGCALTQF
jgi:hypothetical protein